MYYTWLKKSPVGPLLLAGDDQALRYLHFDHRGSAPTSGLPHDSWEQTDQPFREVIRQLNAYFAGKLQQFSVPHEGHGTAFQRRVWRALQDVPYGQTASYGQIAASIGQPTAARAVGMANGRNPISIIVPCHRVIGSSGRLVGYGGGLQRKAVLLRLEQVALPKTAGRHQAAG